MSKLRLTARGEVATGVIVLLALILAGWVLLVMLAGPASATACVNPPTGNVYCHPSATISYPRPTLSHSATVPAVSPRTALGRPLTVKRPVVRPATQSYHQQPQLANTGPQATLWSIIGLAFVIGGSICLVAGRRLGERAWERRIICSEEIPDELPVAVGGRRSV